MNDKTIRAALRGNAEAAKACTEAGVAIPCHACGGECVHIDDKSFGDIIICKKTGCPGGQHVFFSNVHEALKAHNTRAPLPTEPNEPLTLDELREMQIATPVWMERRIVRSNGKRIPIPKGWAFVKRVGDDLCIMNGITIKLISLDDADQMTAYRRPPEGVGK